MSVPDGVPSLLTLNQASRAIDLSPRTVRHWLDKGIIPSVQPGGRASWRLVNPADLAEFAERNGIQVNWKAVI